MSARVLNPIMFSELYTIRSPVAIRNALSTRKLNQIKKDLFGPTDSLENKRTFENELDRHHDTACKKWGFDFRSGYPLSNHNQYIWERVSYTEFIPEVYTLSRAAHVREVPEFEPTERDLLMDERAARENSPSATEKLFLQEVVEFKVPLDDRLAIAGTSTSGKRQPKITDYMKERKRLASTPKKSSPVKRLRSNCPLTTQGASFRSDSNRSKMP
ncbi:unnamed protein product [Hermetia illucens]|uniref:Cyclin-dependent kinase inhibitor domain-containing protein n=1 Tax=Hermetia illucens TaxID=343691 RepID=A0A7R8UYN6_HERIL|nr:uncharacterized protein LOC119654230 [Hermetia illucens]CAD7088931.1 unnamed protein product [Hermetia illucens]